MPIKRCCIKNCKSSSTRNEDKGVTYHKYPKDAKFRDIWRDVTHFPNPKSMPPSFVCSRHFCKGDFLKNKDFKYILKSDAVPSIFPWDTINMEAQQSSESAEEPVKTDEDNANVSGSSKGSEVENVDNIKKFIEAQEKDIQDQKAANSKNVKGSDENVDDKPASIEALVVNLEMDLENLEKLVENVEEPVGIVVKSPENVVPDNVVNPNAGKNVDEDTMAVASSVMEMILSETEAKAMESQAKDIPKQKMNSGSMPLSVGSKVEAKDFSEEWYPAEILEVDYDEMEVLVHYENALKKSDEWISVSSPRLRPYTGISAPKREQPQSELVKLLNEVKEVPKEIKIEDKNKYVVGERCLARWRDNRRFVAVIDKDLGDGKFEVIFDDGVRWTCSVSRLSKLKDTRELTVDTAVPLAGGAASPVLQGGPSSGTPSPVLAFHTHLFDPTRDYLGSKSERREKKRKLNIKEIFNIGQKKAKIPKIEKEKVPKEKKVVKKVVKPKLKVLQVKTEKLDLSDAVVSIIGSDTKAQSEIKTESTPMDVDEMDQPKEFTDSKTDLDLVDNEDKLERFDKPDQVMHEEVMDKMKEAISKLEGGLKEDIDIVSNSPKFIRMNTPKPCIDVKLEKESPKPGVDSPKPEFTPPLQPELSCPKLELVSPKPMFVSPKPEVDSPKPEFVSPKSDLDILKIEIDSPKVVADPPRPITDATTQDIEIGKPDAGAQIIDQTTENQEVDNDTSTTDIEVSVVDLPSPSLIDTSEADFERIVPDDDSTKSDIEMGPESPRLDIDSQPILVDIDAPLDADPPDDDPSEPFTGTVLKKPKKLRIKDFVKKPKKVKKEQKKKKLLNKKWKEVDKVKTELFEMKAKMRQMILEIEREKQATGVVPLPESSLLPTEWACRWVNGQPVGKVSEMEADGKPEPSGKPALPRRSVEVVDKRLPAGWTKHMVRRSVGHSAGKWDVVLVSPTNRRFHTKTDMRNFMETADESTKAYEHALMDFGVHLKLARKMGWILNTPDGITEGPETILPADSKSSLSPLVKRKNLSLKRRAVGPVKDKVKKRPIKLKLQRRMHTYNSQLVDPESETSLMQAEPEPVLPALEDGYVWVGSLKVQMIENLLRCPAEGCFKNFRNNTLLQMHIKHYHRELRKMMGATPKVLDLAAARSKPTAAEIALADNKAIKVKMNKPPKREEPKHEYYKDADMEMPHAMPHTPTKYEGPKIPRSQDSPKLRNALNKPVKRPKVLLPVRRLEPEESLPDSLQDDDFENFENAPDTDIQDFETAISTHTVTKPLDKKKKGDKKQKSFAAFSKNISEDEEWFAMNSDEVDTRSSFPRSGTPDESKMVDPKTGLLMSSDQMDDQMDPSLYTFTETGQRIKIVHMRREEIINCHCGFREEDGLMVQCELCLCWQHALCHNIQKESEVPEKYTCSICLNPRRGRRSKRFLHDQDRLYEGLLPGAKTDEPLRRSHELAGNLLRVFDCVHALKVKGFVAFKRDHPKLYLWAKDWEQAEMTYKLNSDYSDLSIMINGMDKENLPMKPDDPNLMDMRGASEDDPDSDRYSQRDVHLGSQALLSGLLSSPSAASLELPISTSELERLAKSVQEAAAEWQGQTAQVPQPEAAIDNDVCRERLLKHIQRCQAIIDSRLDSIEAQVAELESQDPSFGEHYETAEHYPRIKQTVQMLLRDLDTMEELGVIT